MTNEKEVIWLVKLLNSKYTKGLINSKCGCKRDFEVELNIFENDKNFRKFLDELINESILELRESYKRGKYYTVNRKNVIKRLNNEPVYILFKKTIDQNLLLLE